MSEAMMSLRILSVDREILLMIFPFEISLRSERLRGSLEFRNDGNIKFLWQTKSTLILDEQELQDLAFSLMQEYESQSEAETRNLIKQELAQIILAEEV